LLKLHCFYSLAVSEGGDFGIRHLGFILESPKWARDQNVAKGVGQVRITKSSREPLLQGGTPPRAWIILPPRIEASFLERWFSALAENQIPHQKMRGYDEHWEHKEVIADLKKNCSPFSQQADAPFSIPPHIHFQFFLWSELRMYGIHLNRVVEINRALRQCSETLAAAHRQSERAAARARLVLDLGPLFEQLSNLRLRTVEFEKDYWDEAFSVGSFTSDYAKESLDIVFPRIRRISDSLCLPPIRQERNLDSTFQIRVGDLLREYGTNPYGKRLSLLTISRLVLLVYICAGMANDIDGDLIISGSNPYRKLTVDRTYETLRDAGLR
jgi:hypothetical protein